MRYAIDPKQEDEGVAGSASLQAIIIAGEFECPICRQKNKCQREGEVKCNGCEKLIFAFN